MATGILLGSTGRAFIHEPFRPVMWPCHWSNSSRETGQERQNTRKHDQRILTVTPITTYPHRQQVLSVRHTTHPQSPIVSTETSTLRRSIVENPNLRASAPRTVHGIFGYKHRNRGGVPARHAGIRLVGQVPHQEQQRLPGGRPPPGTLPLHRHHGRSGPRWRIHRGRRRPRLQVRHFRHVAGGGHRLRRAVAQPSVRRNHPEAQDLHGLPDADSPLRQHRNPDLGHRHVGLHTDAVCHVHRRLRHHFRGPLRLGALARHRHRRRNRPGLLHHRRHVVHHFGRPGPVRHQDGGNLLPHAPLRTERCWWPRRHPRPRR
ncbi:hypothetical protein D3C73_933480 [compost metagenome]